LPVVLYGCETWSFILREEHRLRVLRKIFGPKRDEVTREWTQLHNKELYSSPNIVGVIKSRRMSWAEHVAPVGGEERHTQGFGSETRGKEPLGRPRHRWEDNIKMDLQEVGYGGMDWVELAQDRERWQALVNVVMNLQVP